MAYRRWGKRAFDVVAAAALILLLSPFLAAIALVTLVTLGSPVFFRQERPGLAGKPFYILKFRTMLDAVDAHGEPLPDHQRLKPTGSFLRRHSLDEFPELFNVLRGEMSLVGPRPLLMRYLPRYTTQ